MRTRFSSILVVVIAAASSAGCSSSSHSCDPIAQTGCGSGQVCENVQTGGTMCATPVVVSGHVFSLATSAGIGGARVIGMDPNHAPISSVATTAADGSFSVRVAVPRTSAGAPAGDVLLRADAQGYRTFPSGVRQAFPISTAGAVASGGVLVVSGPQTDVGLETYTGGGTGSIRGVATVPRGAPGVLVVADRVVNTVTVGANALADRDGDYAIFNLPADSYTVHAFARGAVHESKPVTLTDGQNATGVNLGVMGSTSASVAGSVQLVNPGAGTGTSVILVVESTFDEKLVRGEFPPGLRAPQGLVPDLKGNYAIAGVPPGRYVALAAFENDFLVRDPDLCIGGTQIIHFEVPQPSGTVTLAGFKVTGSLDVISPGATTPDTISLTTDGPPVFTWQDDSSEDAYELTVIDSLGNEVWSTQIPGSSGTNPSVTYAGSTLSPGYYQFKAKSSKGTCTVGGQTVLEYLSTTEDLKGVFEIVP